MTQTTLADLGQLIRPYRGEEYMQRYFARADVRAALWAFCSVTAYYLTTILLYFLLQNILGHAAAHNNPHPPRDTRPRRPEHPR